MDIRVKGAASFVAMLCLSSLTADRLAEMPRPWARPAERLTVRTYLGSLNWFAARNPGLAKLTTVGYSPKGLPVCLLKLTDASIPDEDKNVILITCFHSGSERTGTAGVMATADWLLGGSKEANEALRKNVVLIMPIVNPEGYFTSEHWGNSRNMDVYALGRGNRMNLDTLELKKPEDGPEVMAYRAVADKYHPDFHLDVHGTGFHFNGHIQISSIGRAGSNSSLMCWDDRLVRRLTAAANRDGWGYFLFESDPQRLVWGAAMGEATKPYCDSGAPYCYSQTYGYVRHHTMPMLLESTWADQVLSPVKELFAYASGPMCGGPVPGFAVNRIKSNLALSLEPYGTTRSARRESRVELWRKQRHFTLSASYPDTANWRMTVLGYGRDALRTIAGDAAGDPSVKWVYASLAEIRRRLEGRRGFNLAEIDRFISAAPPATIKLPFEKPDFDGSSSPSPSLEGGVSFSLVLPTADNEILHLALNGNPLSPSATDGFLRWTEDGFTFVRVNIPPERADRERLWFLTCAWKPVGMPERFGWIPGAETAKWIASPAFTESNGGAECAHAEKIDAYWRKHHDKFRDPNFTGGPDDDDVVTLDISKCMNVAGSAYGSFAEVTHADGSKTKAASVISGSRDDGAAAVLRGTPAALTVEFTQPRLLCGAAIWPGILGNAGNASGECGVRSYVIEYFNNGYWHKASEATNMPSFAASKAKGADDYRFVHAFAKPVNATAIRMKVTESGDTGKRNGQSGILPPDRRISTIRAFEAYETATDANRLTVMANVLSGDFRLPVYREQNEASISLHLDGRTAPFDVRMDVREENSKKILMSRNVRLGRGVTHIVIPLNGLPDGRHVVAFTALDPGIKGDLCRMLRIDRGGRAVPPAEPVDVTGTRIFPVDDFHFSVREGVANEVVPAETIETTRPLAPGRCVQDSRGSNWINRREDGTFVMKFRDADWNRRNWNTHYSVSRDLKTWHITDDPPGGRPNVGLPSPWDPLPPPARPKWQVRVPFKDAKIRFHNPSDGKPPLSEVRVAWFPPSLGDVAGRGLTPWGNYPVWEKNLGEWIVLTKDPIMVCKFGFEPQELEDDLASNDNFGDQFLSDDGRTVFFEQAAKLRRFPPYTVEYDNLRQATRILRTFWSNDGFTWRKRFFAIPTEHDHWSWQHYGIANFRVSRNFYLGYLHAYPANRQQIYPEIVYSRDGLNWNRIPGARPFISNTPPGTWLSGMVFLDPVPPLEHEGRYVIPIGLPHRNMHFYLYNLRNTPERLTAEYVKQCYGGRNLAEQWPFFKEIGGWEGLAKDMREYSATVGIALFRKDGWIAVKAGEGGGRLVSRIFTASDAKLVLNAKGRIRVALRDSEGKPIRGYDAHAVFDGDDTAAELAWDGHAVLPDVPFTVEVTLSPGTELYTLAFKGACVKGGDQ